MSNKSIKLGQYVKGLWSPFVHGKVISVEGEYVRLDNGGVYPKQSVKPSSSKEVKNLPDFIKTLKNSKRGLNIL